jgi:hypothetical protein
MKKDDSSLGFFIVLGSALVIGGIYFYNKNKDKVDAITNPTSIFGF